MIDAAAFILFESFLNLLTANENAGKSSGHLYKFDESFLTMLMKQIVIRIWNNRIDVDMTTMSCSSVQ